MTTGTGKQTRFMKSLVLAGIGLAALYWLCESFMFFFMAPDANIFDHLFGTGRFSIWTRLLVLCVFAIFISHVRYTYKELHYSDALLRAQDEKYRMIVQNIDEGIFEVDLAGDLIFFNSAVCNILGYSREELIGMNNREYTSPETARIMYRIMNLVYRTGEPSKISDFEVIRKDGTTATVELSAYRMCDYEGKPIGFRGVAWNVTEKFEIEKEKKKMETHFHQGQKMEAIGNLAGGIAHDFNNILMGMQGNVSLLLIGMDQNHPYYEKVKSIENYIESGAALSEQLLGFARGGKYKARTIDLNQVLKKAADKFRRTTKQINVVTEGLKEVWHVEADQSQIEQILLNLFVNASQAMSAGGDIHLATENVIIDETFVKPYIINLGPYVKITVTDTGIGMDESTRKRVFEPFFTTRKMGRGTGLGLASTYGIVKNHGGFIEADSEPGKGTTFQIYLPASKILFADEDEHFAEMPKGSETILLVDDEQMIIEVGQEILKTLGYKVFSTTSGREAIEIYAKNMDSIDIVILDMIMPSMSGGDTFDELKTIDPNVRVLLCSGYSLSGQATEILDRGCGGFIQKPFKLKELSLKIREVLDK